MEISDADERQGNFRSELQSSTWHQIDEFLSLDAPIPKGMCVEAIE